ncbi:MAG: hypothetical protein ABIR24_08320 [Verrucomicrobiota bacterium]
MGLFKKKADPISERAKALNAEIAALESQIKKLNSEAPQNTSHLRVRSTALPHGATIPVTSPVPPEPKHHEPVFEEVNQHRLQTSNEKAASPEQFNQLGLRKYDLVGFLGRLKGNFRARPTANPKLVNYLASGSIQGLRPLRYEKRVARNRFLVLTVVLLLVLWGIIAMIWRHH